MSNSTLSATSREERANVTAAPQRNMVDGHPAHEEDDLDEMEVEYIEVNFKTASSISLDFLCLNILN